MTRSRIFAISIMVMIAFMISPVRAQSCSFSVTNMNFGSIDTLSGSQTNSTATINMNCSGIANNRIVICPHLAAGTGGASSAAARQMASGANLLNYQLYSDSGRSVVWGSYAWAYSSRPPALSLTLNSGGTASGTATIYGAVLGSQGTAATGTYLSTFSGANVEFRYRYTTSTSCSTGVGSIAPDPTFTINASVLANCLVSTQNVDFGTTGVLTANVDAVGKISVTCTPATAYTVSLNGGISGGTPTARRMTKSSEFVVYGLYKDANRTQPWGDSATPGSTVAGSGNGAVQDLNVYGRVAPQTTPSAGVYSDTVVVTITF